MRHIVVHYHLFKNAGTTLDAVLKQHFGEACGAIEGAHPWETLAPDDVAGYAVANPGVRAISSHQARLPLPEAQGVVFHPVVFLRHPIDRVGSVFEFERRQPPQSPSLGARIAREQDFAAYVRWRLTPGNGAVIRNFQTTHLSARERDMRTAQATPSDLAQARDRLAALPFFGLVERFERSLEKMRDCLSPHVGDLSTRHTVANSSEGRKATLDERLRDIERELGSGLYARLQEENALDLDLYRHASRLFCDGEPATASADAFLSVR
ncbi:hypothetical protein ACFWZ4_03720 [Frateuria sp. GZRe12]|uniref:hypothetical protein n=1 Tax=Frateuria sp. GZRe12 TaxID=3351533 RepID=UPI003EDBB6D7